MIYVLISTCRRLTMVCQDVTSSSQGGRSKALGVFLQCIPDQTTLPVWVATWRWYVICGPHNWEDGYSPSFMYSLSSLWFCCCSLLCAWCTAVVMYVIFFPRDWSVSIHATITLVNQLDPQKSYTKSYICVMSVANEYRLGIILWQLTNEHCSLYPGLLGK